MNSLWLSLLLSSVIWAEEQYFPQLPNATWDEARLYCQSCFKELTTITSRNVHLIVKNLSSDYWVGLRRRYNDSFPWAAWSNGDPVTYQNWYPGHPIPDTEKKLIPICSSTTQSPTSTIITSTTATPKTSLGSSTVTSAPVTFTKTSTMFQSKQADNTCPILIEMLDCLNMTCYDLESMMTTCNRTTTVTPKTTTYNTTSVVTTFSTTVNAATSRTTTESTTTGRTTASNCIFKPKPDPEQYIDDACVVLLSFGMWKEKDCNKSLPYICYDERFFGQIYVSDVKTSSVNLSWTEGPGAKNISHYRVEITETSNQTLNQTFNQTFIQTDLFEHIQNLTAGTLYSVQVFPVKCGRDLNPQNISFYTQPSDVQNLTVVEMTIVTANLNWSKPKGNCQFYLVTFINDSKTVEQKCYSEDCTITRLIPGTEYEFTVKAVVNTTFGGVPSSVSNYTIPSTVKNLKQLDVSDSTTIQASWEKPDGRHSGYRYCLKKVSHSHECTKCNIVTDSSNTTSSTGTTNFNITDCNTVNATIHFINETDKPDGSKFCLCVAALTMNDSLSGEMVVIPTYTRPKTVILFLTPKSQTIDANWTIEKGNYEIFELTITATAYSYTMQDRTTDFNYTFKDLKAGVYYTISVVTRNGNLTSIPAKKETYTSPAKPVSVTAFANKTTINVRWEAPEESRGATINYTVQCHSPFWNDFREMHTTKTELTFPNLRSGTNYICNVLVVVGNSMSEPETSHAMTAPIKRTLVLTMLCSSEMPLDCNKPITRKDLFDKLKYKFTEIYKDMVHWNLNWETSRNNI